MWVRLIDSILLYNTVNKQDEECMHYAFPGVLIVGRSVSSGVNFIVHKGDWSPSGATVHQQLAGENRNRKQLYSSLVHRLISVEMLSQRESHGASVSGKAMILSVLFCPIESLTTIDYTHVREMNYILYTFFIPTSVVFIIFSLSWRTLC